MRECSNKYSTPRADDLYDLFPLEMIWIFQGRYIPDLYDLSDLSDLYDLAHVGGREPNDLHDLLIKHVSWVGSVLHR